jgi:type II secretory pathway pseudopilin PulG
MQLRGQQGYAMAALLVGMAIMAVLMTVAMPVWRQAVRREKEAELVFRGQQYVRAIRLFSQRAGPGVLPPNLDVLVTQKFLRKKYKDPITGQDFDLLGAMQAAQAGAGFGQGGQPSSQPGRGAQANPPGRAGAPASPQGGRGAAPMPSPTGTVVTPSSGRGGSVPGGIMGVASKSKDSSIRLYNGRSHYNEWAFIYIQQVQQPGTVPPGGQPQRGGGPQRGGPTQRGRPGPQSPGIGPGGGPGGPSRPNAPQTPFPGRPPQR